MPRWIAAVVLALASGGAAACRPPPPAPLPSGHAPPGTPAVAPVAGDLTGNLSGVLTDAATHRPLDGAVVIVTTSRDNRSWTAVADARGTYLVAKLPPSNDYLVTIYYTDTTIERVGNTVAAGKTTHLSAAISLTPANAPPITVITD